MIYNVRIDGTLIYGGTENSIILQPSAEMELNSAGSFKFVLPVGHDYYDLPKLLTSDVEIIEDGEVIWYGRPIRISKDFYNNKSIECEGALAFFNDTIQRPAEFDDGKTSIRSFFKYLIRHHNQQVPANRQFTIGNITIDEKFVYRKLDYECTLACLNDMCLNAEGGYLFIRRVNGKSYIDWLKDVPYTGTQPIQFGVNLSNLAQSLDGTEIRTAILPLGDEVGTTGKRMVVNDANKGFDYVDSKAVDTYGRILEVVEFSNCTEPKDLLKKGKKWLEDQQFDPLSIELNAADLSYVNNNYQNFKMGQKIHVTSTPNLIDKYFPIVKMSIALDSAIKKITIGTLPKRDLTEIYKDDNVSGGSGGGRGSSSSSGSGSSGSGSSGIVYEPGNATIMIKVNNVEVGRFTVNQAIDSSVNLSVPVVETEEIDFDEEW